MKHLLLMLILIQGGDSFARQRFRVVSTDSFEHSFTLRGKIGPWGVLLIPLYGKTASIGVEYQWNNRHAVGIDLAYEDENTHSPEQQDSTNHYYVPSGKFRNAKKSAMLSYRYYLPYAFNWTDENQLYWSLFSRIAFVEESWSDGYQNYVPDLQNLLSHQERHYSLGFLFGIMAPHRLNAVNLDFNIGPYWKWIDIEELRNQNGINVASKTSEQHLGCRIGLTMAWKGKKRHRSM